MALGLIKGLLLFVFFIDGSEARTPFKNFLQSHPVVQHQYPGYFHFLKSKDKKAVSEDYSQFVYKRSDEAEDDHWGQEPSRYRRYRSRRAIEVSLPDYGSSVPHTAGQRNDALSKYETFNSGERNAPEFMKMPEKKMQPNYHDFLLGKKFRPNFNKFILGKKSQPQYLDFVLGKRSVLKSDGLVLKPKDEAEKNNDVLDKKFRPNYDEFVHGTKAKWQYGGFILDKKSGDEKDKLLEMSPELNNSKINKENGERDAGWTSD